MCSEGPAAFQSAHVDRMIRLHLWGMRERRILKRAKTNLNKAPREPIDQLAAGHVNIRSQCDSVVYGVYTGSVKALQTGLLASHAPTAIRLQVPMLTL